MKNKKLTLEEICTYLESNGWVKHPKVNEYAHTRCYTDNQITLIFMSCDLPSGTKINFCVFDDTLLSNCIVDGVFITYLSDLQTILGCVPREYLNT